MLNLNDNSAGSQIELVNVTELMNNARFIYGILKLANWSLFLKIPAVHPPNPVHPSITLALFQNVFYQLHKFMFTSMKYM